MPVKLIKIRFTSWRDHSVAPSTLVLEEQLGTLITREVALRTAAASAKAQPAHAHSEVLQESLVSIAEELRKIDTERRALLSAERTAAAAETRAATEHKKVGSFGFQLLNAARGEVVNIVDESGNDLPADAVYAYEVVDTDPPLPGWAKKGKIERYE
jgi:hypothetical protein